MEWQLLGELSEPDRRAVLSSTRRRTWARGEVLFHEGDPADTVHFIAEGRVMARRVTEHGDSVAFRVMGRGRVLGDVAVPAAESRRYATIVALEPTITLSLTFEQFRLVCTRYPSVEHYLTVLLAARVRRLSDHLLEALYVSSDQRVVNRLLDLCREYATADGVPVTIPLTQTDLAELAGAGRPTANRVLRGLAGRGLVVLSRGRVLVPDAARLERAVRRPPAG